MKPIHNLHIKKDELFPDFYLLNFDNKKNLNTLHKNKKSIILSNINNLNIDDEIEKVKLSNDIRNKDIMNKKIFFKLI